MNFMEYQSAFARDGFVIVPEFLAGDDFHELTAELERYITQVVPTLPDRHAFYQDRERPETLKQLQHMTVDPYFEQYARHPRWMKLAETLLGEEVSSDGPEWFNKPAGVIHPTPPHQDNYYFNLTPPNVVTIWLALENVDEENGCLRYVSGSHRLGFRPHAATKVLGFSQGISDYGPEDEAREVKICLKPGDAVVHHGNTIHRADPNRSANRNRPAFAMVIRGVSCRRDEEGFARYSQSAQAQHEVLGLKT